MGEMSGLGQLAAAAAVVLRARCCRVAFIC